MNYSLHDSTEYTSNSNGAIVSSVCVLEPFLYIGLMYECFHSLGICLNEKRYSNKEARGWAK